ncbi:MAG: acyl-CoA dehydrogenase family protein [Anaerolineales bacterium]|nr:MAG: acyl-CoA dehydrogenase family protein [Anaerolineales bacterium]
MDFSLTEEQRMFRDMFRDFSQGEIAPNAEHLDKTEEAPTENLQKIAMQGLLTATLPEAYGGAELDTLSYSMWLEELAKVCMTTAVAVHIHGGMVGMSILTEGSDAQKEQYLPQLAAGERIGAFAWSEPNAGSDAGGLLTRALKDGDDYILTGRKAWISNGAIAGLFLVFARTNSGGGLGAFLVERETEGLRVGRTEPTLGLRGLGMASLHLDRVRVPASNLLGGVENQGYAQAMRALDYGRMSVSAIALGAAQQALDYGVKFASERIQFGVPIAQKQAIQNYLAESAAKILALRHLVSYVAWLADLGMPYSQEAAAAKLLGAEVAMWVANKMVQVHGGYGYMKEYPIERIYRDCRALDLIEGTGHMQRIVLASGLFKPYGVTIAA